jgi:hypothetical protein
VKAEARKTLAAAEMAALCALLARHGIAPSPYGGTGWPTPDLRMAKGLERTALMLVEKAQATK